MTIKLRQSTASQEVPLGYFVDSGDGNSEETGLTIANTDIKIWKMGATTLANKNSGGATHISNGVYYCVLDATDTNTLGALKIFVHVSGALPVVVECEVLTANVYDSLIAGSDVLDVSLIQWLGTAPLSLTSQRVNSNVQAVGGTVQTAGDILGIIGALATAAGTGDPNSSKTIMGYVKQIVNVLIGTAGIATFPAEAAPANAVSLAEVIRAIHADVTGLNGSAMRGTDGANTQTPLDAAGVRSAVGLASANLDTQLDALPTAAENRAEMDSNSTQLAAIVADTNEMQTDDVPGLIAALNNLSAAAVNAEVDSALADYDGPTRAELTSDINSVIAYLDGLVIAKGTIGSTGNDTTHLHLTGLTYGDDEINNYLLAVYDNSAGEWHARYIEDWADTGDLATVATLPFTPEDAVDTYVVLAFRQDVTGGSGLDAAGVRAAVGLASANLDTQLDALPTAAENRAEMDSNSTQLAAIVADTNEMQTDLADGGRLDLLIDAILADTNELQSDDYPTTLAAILADTNELQGDWTNGGRLDLIIDAILADTNELQTDDIPGAIAALNNLSAAAVNAEVDSALADYDGPTRAELTSDINSVIAYLNGLVIAKGTIGATGNDTTHLHLTGLTYGDDEVNNYLLAVYDNSAGEWHARYIEDWADTGDLATVATLPFTPEDSVDSYVILAFRQDVTGGSGLDAAGVRAAVGLASANLDTQLDAIPTAAENRAEMDSNSTQLAAIVADTNEMQTDLADGGRLDLLIDAILADTNELQTDDVPGLIAALNNLSLADIRTAVGLASANLDTQLAAIVADTNELQGDWVNGGRLDLLIDAIKAKTDNLPTDPADASDIAASFSTVNSTLATIAGYIDTEVAAILADTNELQTDWADGGRLDLLIDAIKVVTDLLNSAQAEPTGAPAANETPLIKLGYLFMALRNKFTTTNSAKTFYDDDGNAEWSKSLTDDGATYTEGEGS